MTRPNDPNDLKARVDSLPSDLRDLLPLRDAARELAKALPTRFTAAETATADSEAQFHWETCGLALAAQNRLADAIPIFSLMYDQMLAHQGDTGLWTHKGMPLVWLTDCYASMGYRVHARRYMMLTACEDAIRGNGYIDAETTGSWFRMVWRFGIAPQEVARYASAIWSVSQEFATESLFPEWVLLKLDQRWMTDVPSALEVGHYVITRRFAELLYSRMGDGTGTGLEYLAQYLLSCIPGCRAQRHAETPSTEYDVICALEGAELDFRAEFGRYFVCECKDWNKPADFSATAKFCQIVESARCHCGILFSREGISGAGKTVDAERQLLKSFQARGTLIIVLCEWDLRQTIEGANLLGLLRQQYETLRFDLAH